VASWRGLKPYESQFPQLLSARRLHSYVDEFPVFDGTLALRRWLERGAQSDLSLLRP
jgi:hypothetical protein